MVTHPNPLMGAKVSKSLTCHKRPLINDGDVIRAMDLVIVWIWNMLKPWSSVQRFSEVGFGEVIRVVRTLVSSMT
jgi:hypothetical protein